VIATPLTDERELSFLDIQHEHGKAPFVEASFARDLERELYATRIAAGVASLERGEWAVERDDLRSANAALELANRELIGLLEKKIRDGMAERFIAIADHIQENADALKKYEWEGNEARCRELCSMYIRELAHTIQMDEMLARIDAALKGGKE
jgi:uncharacterized protein YpiB (UPF0302 family)